jgi:hypothetical protein
MSDWISWKELIEHFGIKDIDVIDCLVGGLQPFTKLGKPEPCPKHYHKGDILQHEKSNIDTDLYVLKDTKDTNRKQNLLADSKITKEKKIIELTEKKMAIEIQLQKIDQDDDLHESWKYFKLPKSDKSIENIFGNLQDSLFKKSDIIEHFPKIDKDALISEIYIKEKYLDIIPTRTELAVKRNKKIIISFYKKGDIWWIGEKGKELNFKPLNGLEYILFLIRNSNQNFHPLEVYYSGDVPPELQKQMFEPPQKLGKLDKKFDSEALQEQAEQIFAKSDPEKYLEIKEEITKIMKFQDEGKYNFPQEANKIRVNVYNSIKRAVQVIQRKLKEQGDNYIIKLFDVGSSKVIRSGTEFCYNQELIDFEVEWQLDPE